MNELREYALSLDSQNWPSWPSHRPKAWGYNNVASLQRIGADPDLPSSYRLQFTARSYATLAVQLGWIEDPGRNSFEPPSLQHLALLVSQANEPLAADLRERLAAYQPVTERISVPCLHYYPSKDIFAVAAGATHHRWLRTIGFHESVTTKLWVTTSPLAAAPLARLATEQAYAALKRALPRYRIVKDFKKEEPLTRPWMGYDVQNRRFQIHANQIITDRLIEIAPDAFERTENKAIITTASIKAAVALRLLAEPRLKQSLHETRFLDLDPVEVADLLGQVVQDKGAAQGSKKAGPEAKPEKELRFQRKRKLYVTRRPEAAADPRWTQDRTQLGAFVSADTDAAIALRVHADDEAEMAIQRAMVSAKGAAADLRASTLSIPKPADPSLVYRSVQEDGIRFSASRRFSINADPMGFGKTAQAVGTAETSGASTVVVVTLASVAPAFTQAFQDWTGREDIQLFLNPRDTPPQRGVTVASYEAITAHHEALPRAIDLLVIDEVHKAKNDAAQRTRALRDGLAPRAGAIMALSGTPVPRRPQDVFSILNMGAPDVFPSRKRFAEIYGISDLKSDDEERQERRKLLGETLYSGILIRRSKSLLGLPPKSRNTVTLNKIDLKLAEDLEREGLALRAMMRSQNTVERSRIMVELQQMRMKSALRKVPAAIDWALRQRGLGHRFVMFAHHHAVLEALETLARQQGLDPIPINGRTGDPRKRQEMITRFQKGAGDGVIAGISAAGTGTTMTAASRCLMVELDWNPFEMLQAEDRLHRIGQMQAVEIDYLVFASSVDARIASIADHKLKMADDVLGLDGETIDECLLEELPLAA